LKELGKSELLQTKKQLKLMIETLEKKYNKGAADVAPAIATKKC